VSLVALAATGLVAAGALAHPGSGIAVDEQGRVFFVDTGVGVWTVDGEGRLRRHEGPAFHWMAIDPRNGFGDTDFPHMPTTDMRAAGRDPMLLLSSDYPVVVGADGALYFAEPRADGRLEIVRLSPSGERGLLTTLPAASDGAPLRWLNGIAARDDGSIYYAENAAVRRIDPRGSVATVAASIEVPACERMPRWEPHLGPYLRGLDVAADGTVYVAATGCGAVLRISPGGETAPVLRASLPWAPTGVAVHGGDVYVLEYTHDASGEDRRDWIPRVRKLTPDGSVVTVVVIERTPSPPAR
jgi:hypothetical protein